MNKILALLALTMMALPLSQWQIGDRSFAHTSAVTPGSFTLRYSTPAANTNCTNPATDCVVSLSGTPIIAGDLLAYSCIVNPSGAYASISSVSNGGTFVPVYSTIGAVHSAGETSMGYILSAAAETGSETINFTGTQGGAACSIYEYSYTGTPELDGANSGGNAASVTAQTMPIFTPSTGSNQDVSVISNLCPYVAPSSVSSPFTMPIAAAGYTSAWANVGTSAETPTWTFSSACGPIVWSQMSFGFNTTPFAQEMFVNFQGTNGAAVTPASVQGNEYGWRPVADVSSGVFTYSTAASNPLQNPTGRLDDGGSYADTSTTGIVYNTSSGPLVNIQFNSSLALSNLGHATLGAWIQTDDPGTNSNNVDMLNIYGQNNSDFINAMSFASGSGTRYISMECGTGQNHAQDYPISLNTWYWVEEQYNQGGTHYLKVYSDANPPVLLATLSCAAVTGGGGPGYYLVGNNNSNTPVTGYHYYYDSLKVSLDGGTVLP